MSPISPPSPCLLGRETTTNSADASGRSPTTRASIRQPLNVGSFTIPFNLSWHPAASVRIGLSRQGLPMGMQIVGPNHGEMACLQLAHAYDEATGWVAKRPPPLLGTG